MTAPLLVHDNLGDRREVYQLLKRLPPRRRVEWLAWCCQQTYLPCSKIRPRVAQRTTGRSVEVFMDFWALVAQYDLDPEKAVNRLAEMVRRPTRTAPIYAA